MRRYNEKRTTLGPKADHEKLLQSYCRLKADYSEESSLKLL